MLLAEGFNVIKGTARDSCKSIDFHSSLRCRYLSPLFCHHFRGAATREPVSPATGSGFAFPFPSRAYPHSNAIHGMTQAADTALCVRRFARLPSCLDLSVVWFANLCVTCSGKVLYGLAARNSPFAINFAFVHSHHGPCPRTVHCYWLACMVGCRASYVLLYSVCGLNFIPT